MLVAVLMLVALVLFVVAVFGVPTGRYGLVPAGLAFWVAAELIKLGIF